jgi:hypothetical protein
MAAFNARNGTDPALAALDPADLAAAGLEGAGLDGAGPDGAALDGAGEPAGVSAPF